MKTIDKDFTRFYHPIVDSGLWARLSNIERAVYPVLLRFGDYGTGESFPSVELIAKLAGVSESSVCRATKSLFRIGLIEVKKRPGTSNLYRIVKDKEKLAQIVDSLPARKRVKCTKINRGKNGKFKSLPKKTNESIPSGTEEGIPSPTVKGIPSPTVKGIPSGTERKYRYEREILNRDKNHREKEKVSLPKISETPFGCQIKSLKKIKPETINGLINQMGLGRTQKYLREQGYPEEEIQSLGEIAPKEEDAKQNKTDPEVSEIS